MVTDHQRDKLLHYFTSGEKSPYISAINVIEAGCHRDVKSRTDLLNILSTLTGENRPLKIPGEILKASLRQYARDPHGNYIASVEAEGNGLWRVLKAPQEIGEKEILDLENWKSQSEWIRQTNLQMRRELRAGVEHLRRQGKPHDLPATPAKLMKWCWNNEDHLTSFFPKLFEAGQVRWTNVAKIRQVLTEVLPWRIFFAAMLYCTHRETVPKEMKKIPGSLDFQQAVYAYNCDYFVTADKEQYRLMRHIKRLLTLPVTVVSYQQFRDDALQRIFGLK